MRDIQEVVAEYEVEKQKTDMVAKEGTTGVYVYENYKKRDALREEYISLLPQEKQLAIKLHSILCQSNHSDQCSFHYEIKGIEDDWSGWAHARYLKKAEDVLAYTDNRLSMYELVKFAELLARR